MERPHSSKVGAFLYCVFERPNWNQVTSDAALMREQEVAITTLRSRPGSVRMYRRSWSRADNISCHDILFAKPHLGSGALQNDSWGDATKRDVANRRHIAWAGNQLGAEGYSAPTRSRSRRSSMNHVPLFLGIRSSAFGLDGRPRTAQIRSFSAPLLRTSAIGMLLLHLTVSN